MHTSRRRLLVAVVACAISMSVALPAQARTIKVPTKFNEGLSGVTYQPGLGTVTQIRGVIKTSNGYCIESRYLELENRATGALFGTSGTDADGYFEFNGTGPYPGSYKQTVYRQVVDVGNLKIVCKGNVQKFKIN